MNQLEAQEILEEIAKKEQTSMHIGRSLDIETEEINDELFDKIWEISETLDEATINDLLKDINGKDYSLEPGITTRKLKERGRPESGIWHDYLMTPESKRKVKEWFTPKNIGELEEVLAKCHENNMHIKPFGGKHSSSDVARPNHDMSCLDLSAFRFDETRDKDEVGIYLGKVNNEHLVHIEAGISVKIANCSLCKLGYALPNMGSYDGQSLIGAICTGTHGSNSKVGPMAEFVRAIDMYIIDEDNHIKKVRIQRDKDIPLPDSSIEILEDNCTADLFHQMVISMGCMGIVFGMVLKVEESFKLKETRSITNWKTEKEHFSMLFNYEFADLILNPNEFRGEYVVMKTIRERVSTQSIDAKPELKKLCLPLQKFASQFPRLANRRFTKYLKRNRGGESTDLSYKIFYLGGGEYQATSIEIAVPIDKAVKAIDTIIDLAAKHNFWHTSPIGIRFVKESKHRLSFAYGYNVCTLEIPLLKWQEGAPEQLQIIYDALINDDFKGRPHWGQMNWIDRTTAEQIYHPYFTEWVQLYKKYNARGFFSNEFTERMNLDAEVV